MRPAIVYIMQYHYIITDLDGETLGDFLGLMLGGCGLIPSLLTSPWRALTTFDTRSLLSNARLSTDGSATVGTLVCGGGLTEPLIASSMFLRASFLASSEAVELLIVLCVCTCVCLCACTYVCV